MGLTASLERLFGRAGASASASTSPPPTASAVPVPWLDGRSALALSAVWRCVTLISDVVADWPWTEWQGDELLPSSRLVRRPMVTMSRREWTWRVVATEALFGASHLLHVGGSDMTTGEPWSLLPLPPAAIYPTGYTDPWLLTPPARYVVAGREIDASFISVVRRTPFPGVPDWINGVVNLARTQFTSYLAADIAAARYWRSGGPTQTVVSVDQDLEPEDALKMASSWQAHRSMGADFPIVLGKGGKAEPWGADPTKDASVEARREINADVGRYFGIPTRTLNAPAGDSETYANVEDDRMDLYSLCLRGYAGPVEDTISELLPGDPLEGHRMQLDASKFLQGNLASRAIAWPALTTAGIVTKAEARVRGFGLTPKPAADMVDDVPPTTQANATGADQSAVASIR